MQRGVEDAHLGLLGRIRRLEALEENQLEISCAHASKIACRSFARILTLEARDILVEISLRSGVVNLEFWWGCVAQKMASVIRTLIGAQMFKAKHSRIEIHSAIQVVTRETGVVQTDHLDHRRAFTYGHVLSPEIFDRGSVGCYCTPV